MNHHRAIETTLVKLMADGYSEPVGALGLIEGEDSDRELLAVAWLAGEGGGYRGSADIASEHLEPVGTFLIHVPDTIIDECIQRAAIDIPDELVTRRARELLADVTREIAARTPVV